MCIRDRRLNSVLEVRLLTHPHESNLVGLHCTFPTGIMSARGMLGMTSVVNRESSYFATHPTRGPSKTMGHHEKYPPIDSTFASSSVPEALTITLFASGPRFLQGPPG
eukprot:TRINITY_DN18426_c0_g1_i1.p1 TRINITY_DN18426_c0_g1~~TRINITY_DN18426_c0_g1_i1.p1  ORF type:complete len:108 (+),score=9.22 TRINITY_DN18426_c0_g1_i1:100-423(+)